MREYIDGSAFQGMILCAYDALETNEQAINELNVFPVPDGDTGTNMRLTMGAAATELRKDIGGTATNVADRVASALLRGARGNSGVITSLLFRGLSKGLKRLETASAAEFANALTSGVEAAYKAVMKPAEGTILTVSRLASDAAVEYAKHSSDIEEMLEVALAAGRDALADTLNQNPVLAKAGVVDAGGYGYILMLEAMLGFLQGRVAVSDGSATAAAKPKADFSAFSIEDITFTYCTEFIVRRDNNRKPALLRTYLENIGDCVVVVDDDEIIKIHVHTNDPGKATTKALSYGALLTVKVENMREQHSSMGDEAPAAEADEAGIPEPVPAEKPIGTVCICAGDGMEELFRQLGADGIVAGGQTMNPSTEDILRAVNLTPAETVFVFPNNKNIIMAAEQCAPLTTKQVVVIPTKTVPQGISAMMRLAPESSVANLTADFTSAIGTVHTAQVTYAARDSDFDGHDIHAGEYLTLLDGALVGSFAAMEDVIAALDEVITPMDPEFVTVYAGQDVSETEAENFCTVLGSGLPNTETALVPGGQPVYYYIIGIE